MSEQPASARDDSGPESNEVAPSLLSPELWPRPKWFVVTAPASRASQYDHYYLQHLRSRFVESESDFRSVYGNFGAQFADHVTAARIVELLGSAREILESDAPDLLVVSGLLDVVERYMVWLYPPWVARARVDGVLAKFDATPGAQTEGGGKQVAQLRRLGAGKQEEYQGELRSVLDEVIGSINRRALLTQISSGLQIERLESLRTLGVIMLLLLCAISPVITKPDAWILSVGMFAGTIAVANAMLSAAAIAAIGALGGFLSTLLQIRDSRVSLLQFHESRLGAQLKVILGALLGLTLYVVLSWDLVPGIKVDNGGAYILFAFLSGFSERYFLRLLDVESKVGAVGDTVEDSKPDAAKPHRVEPE